MQTRLMKLHDVEKTVLLKRTAIYQAIAEGQFPKPIKIGTRAVAWREADIEAWIASRETA